MSEEIDEAITLATHSQTKEIAELRAKLEITQEVAYILIDMFDNDALILNDVYHDFYAARLRFEKVEKYLHEIIHPDFIDKIKEK